MPTFNKVWTIINLSKSLDESHVRECIDAAVMPTCMEFKFEVKEFEILPWDQSLWPWGMEPWTIVISDFDDPRFPKNGVNYLGGSSRNRCTVSYVPGHDFQLQLGARIWHEILHCMNIDSDQMDGKDRYVFCKWIRDNPWMLSQSRKDNSSTWCDIGDLFKETFGFNEVLASYYTYLTYLNFPQCYRKSMDIGSIIKRLLEILRNILKSKK